MSAAQAKAHRAAQALIAQSTVADLKKLWPLLDYRDLDASFPAWSQAVGTAVKMKRRTSAGLAGAYMAELRRTMGLKQAPLTLATDIATEQIDAGLLSTGPIAVKSATARGVDQREAMINAFTRSSGSATRLVLGGGRDTIIGSVRNDPAAKGWQRITGSRPCGFCLMLASRGPVYGQDTAGFRAHDNCHCSADPVYTPWQPTAQQQGFIDTYTSAADQSNAEAPRLGPKARTLDIVRRINAAA